MKSYEKTFRVALLVPENEEVPEGFEEFKGYSKAPEKRFFASEWFPGIKQAKDKMDATAQFYNEKGTKFLFFREIRRPIC